MHEYPQLLLGGASLGLEQDFKDAESVKALLSLLRQHDVSRIDTAARYPPIAFGRSESLLGETEAAANGFSLDTKIFTDTTNDGSGDLVPAKSRESLEASLARLATSKVNTLYIHRPDPDTSLGEQARGLDALYREGKFARLGISNFSAALVEQFVQMCEAGGFVAPTVYQGEYSQIERRMERELLPVLRKHGIAFVAFRALAAGFLTGNWVAGVGAEGSRFSDKHPFGKLTQRLYTGDRFVKAHRTLEEALRGREIPPAEAGLRWICYHSALGKEDGLILGASRQWQVVSSIEAIRKGPLPEEVAVALSKIWESIQE